MHLNNKFDLWKVRGIMNTSRLLQSKGNWKGFTLTLQETRSIHDPDQNQQNIDLIFHDSKNYLPYQSRLAC